jgi:hypothetical protein
MSVALIIGILDRAPRAGETGKDSCFHHLEPSNRVGIFLQKVIDVNAVAFVSAALSRKRIFSALNCALREKLWEPVITVSSMTSRFRKSVFAQPPTH